MNIKPTFDFQFKELASVRIQGAPRGILGLLLFDETVTTFKEKEYYSSMEVKEADWNQKNYKILKFLAFTGNPFKVKVYKATAETINEVLEQVKKDEPNYFACPVIPTESEAVAKVKKVKEIKVLETEKNLEEEKSKQIKVRVSTLKGDLVSWINSIRNTETIKLGNDTSTIKLVISADTAPDKPWILDYSSLQAHHEINGLEDVYFNAQEYTACIASMAAGVALNSSLTSAAQPWLKSMKSTITDESAEIKKGKLVTSFDGNKYIILRGVTSFTTPTDSMNRSFSKIRKMEIMDIHQKDIRNTFKEYYRGKYQNIYANKLLFMGAVNAYLSDYIKAGQLNPANENKMKIDIDAHKKFLIEKGVYKGKQITEEDVNKMSEYELLRIDTDDIVFAYVPDYKPTDVMEDFKGEAYL